jgi:tight adherence protein B
MLIWLVLLFFGITFALLCLAVLLIAFAMEKAVPDIAEANVAPQDSPLLRNEQLSSISVWHSLLARFDFVEILKNQLAQADLNWSVGRLTLSMLLCGAITFALVWRVGWIPLWADIGCTWLAALSPYVYVLRLRSKKFDAFADQFPDALDSLSRAMRAGYPLLAGLDLVAKETVPPVSSQVRKLYVETNLGLPISRALVNFRDRVPLPEVDLFAAAVQLHARTGGRLTDVMAGLAESMREQAALRGEVRAIATHGRVTGIILTLLPIGITIMMVVLSPSYIGVLLAHPYGKHLIAAAIFCLIAAHFIMRRIVDIQV